ncbi:MAG: ribonuclease P [Methanobacteriota archaeon]
MVRRTAKEKSANKKIAIVRITRLFRLAEYYAMCGRMNLADRYVALARKISMRYLVSIPAEFKRCYCTHCYRYLLPGVTGRVRVHRGRLIISCLRCHGRTRMPLRRRSMVS